MTNQRVRVAVNGYGVIGKRIADAVAAQNDMTLVGVADVVSDWRIQIAVERGYPVYAATEEAAASMRDAGVLVAGTLDDLLNQVDVGADATPRKSAAGNLERYRAVPETIDAIRALGAIEQDGMQSIAKTNAALGLLPEFAGRKGQAAV